MVTIGLGMGLNTNIDKCLKVWYNTKRKTAFTFGMPVPCERYAVSLSVQ